ncbi:MAG: HXXEE domain-containing protein [Pleomorphochaeta sp.]
MKVKDYYNWLKDNWAHIGFVLAFYLTLFSFVFIKKSNFPVFLIIIQTPLYMLHESEEYLFPGGFQHFFNHDIFKIEQKEGPLDRNFIFFVNIFYIWVLLPLFGIFSIYSINLGLWIPYFTIFAGVSHIALGIKAHKLYNPGLIVSLLLNIPIGILSVRYFLNNAILNNAFFNIYFFIGLSLNLILPIAGKVVYSKYVKKYK